MEKEYIDVKDSTLAAEIRQELRKLKITPKYDNVLDFTKFTKEELDSITRLELVNGGYKDISSLEKLRNLKELKIKSSNVDLMNPSLRDDVYFNYLLGKSKITDYSVISRLYSLETLEIENEENLEYLDLSNLKNLSFLTIERNEHLTKIDGLEELTELSEVIIRRNNLTETIDLEEILEKNPIYRMFLDFDMYSMIKNNNPNIRQIVLDKINKEAMKIMWSENLGGVRYNDLSIIRMDNMDEKINKILNRIIGPNYTELEKITAIFIYITQNVKYDFEGLAAREGKENETLKKARENMGDSTKNILNKLNSSYNAVMNNLAVCEGFSNLMHYMLKKVGIDSVTVNCLSESNINNVASDRDHSIIRVKYNGDWYYFDPTWDRGINIKLNNFFLKKSEIEKNHSLVMSEDNIKEAKDVPFSKEQILRTIKKVLNDMNSGINIINNYNRIISNENKSKNIK